MVTNPPGTSRNPFRINLRGFFYLKRFILYYISRPLLQFIIITMKKACLYLVIFILTLTSCYNSGAKRTNNSNTIVSSEIIDTLKQEQSFLKKKVLTNNTIKRDTTIINYDISYTIQDNEDVILTSAITDGKGLDTVYHAGKVIILDIKYSKENILYKEISRDFFNSYIPEEEIEQYSISYFSLGKVDNSEKIFFTISLCHPDTDICYWFELSVSKRGSIEIKDISSVMDVFESDEHFDLNPTTH